MQKKAEMIYQSLCGNLVSAVPGADDLFAEGGECDCAYRAVREAYGRLLERLGEEEKGEDSDVEQIIDSLFTICRSMTMKMYEYCKKTAL